MKGNTYCRGYDAKIKDPARKLGVKAVCYTGTAIIAVFAVPAVILFGIICAIGKIMSFIADKIAGEEADRNK